MTALSYSGWFDSIADIKVVNSNVNANICICNKNALVRLFCDKLRAFEASNLFSALSEIEMSFVVFIQDVGGYFSAEELL